MKKGFLIFVSLMMAGALSLAWAAEHPKGGVLAKVDNKAITIQDYKEALKQLPPQVQWAVKSDKELQAKFLDNLVTKAILIETAKKSGIEEDEEMKMEIEEFRESLLLNRYLDARLGGVKVTDEEVKDYYGRHKEEFTTPKQVRARHILVKTRKEAQEMERRLKEGEDFAELAKKHSTDHTTAAKGGELGFFSYGDMVKPFSEAAFSLKPGEISPVVETPFGFHIIQVEEVKPAQQKSFQEVKKSIKTKLLREKQQKAFDQLVARLKKEWKVETHPELLQKAFSEGSNK